MRYLLLFLLLGCKNVKEAVQADIWLHDQIVDCSAEVGFNGIYRKIICTPVAIQEGKCQQGDDFYEEYLSYCDANIKNYVSMHKDDFKKWTDYLVDHCN